jgi:hypothetical protein
MNGTRFGASPQLFSLVVRAGSRFKAEDEFRDNCDFGTRARKDNRLSKTGTSKTDIQNGDRSDVEKRRDPVHRWEVEEDHRKRGHDRRNGDAKETGTGRMWSRFGDRRLNGDPTLLFRFY